MKVYILQSHPGIDECCEETHAVVDSLEIAKAWENSQVGRDKMESRDYVEFEVNDLSFIRGKKLLAEVMNPKPVVVQKKLAKAIRL